MRVVLDFRKMLVRGGGLGRGISFFVCKSSYKQKAISHLLKIHRKILEIDQVGIFIMKSQ